MTRSIHRSSFFFFNDTATTEIYTLSLHDALPICVPAQMGAACAARAAAASASAAVASRTQPTMSDSSADRKSTRLNSSHLVISYAVFCLKKKKQPIRMPQSTDVFAAAPCSVHGLL